MLPIDQAEFEFATLVIVNEYIFSFPNCEMSVGDNAGKAICQFIRLPFPLSRATLENATTAAPSPSPFAWSTHPFHPSSSLSFVRSFVRSFGSGIGVICGHSEKG